RQVNGACGAALRSALFFKRRPACVLHRADSPDSRGVHPPVFTPCRAFLCIARGHHLHTHARTRRRPRRGVGNPTPRNFDPRPSQPSRAEPARPGWRRGGSRASGPSVARSYAGLARASCTFDAISLLSLLN
ncbi:hypothetical protein SRHO_G00078850, partial [Serrasalmus rhombeus]